MQSDIATFFSLAMSTAEAVQKARAIGLITDLVRGTPRDTGRTQASWQAALNQEPTGEPKGPPYPSEGEIIARMAFVVARMTLFDKLFIVNTNAPTIYILENGSSAQQPNGWIRMAAKKWGAAALGDPQSATRKVVFRV